jgi:hypothetical protein
MNGWEKQTLSAHMGRMYALFIGIQRRKLFLMSKNEMMNNRKQKLFVEY